ncbi:MAG: DUF2490 domain-containing protein [Bacteroidales bacterium]
MIRPARVFLLFVFFVLHAFQSFSQVNDACLWIGLNLEKKVLPGFSLHLSDELRLNENISEAGTHFTEVGGEYQFARGFSGGVYYRFIQKRRLDDSYSKRHRYYGELTYRYKTGKVSFTLRERFQSQYRDVYSNDKGKVPEYHLRSKLTVKAKVYKATQVYLNSELFYLLSNQMGNEIDGIRSAAGLEYNFKAFGSVELFYMIDKEIHVNNPLTQYIIGLGYNYNF